MPGLLRIELRDAVARGDLQPHALLRHDEKRAALFAGFAEEDLRRDPRLGGLQSRPGRG